MIQKLTQDTFKKKIFDQADREVGYVELRRTNMGRHGGGWDYRLGTQGGERTSIISLGAFIIRFKGVTDKVDQIIETDDFIIRIEVKDPKNDKPIMIISDKKGIFMESKDRFRVHVKNKSYKGKFPTFEKGSWKVISIVLISIAAGLIVKWALSGIQ